MDSDDLFDNVWCVFQGVLGFLAVIMFAAVGFVMVVSVVKVVSFWQFIQWAGGAIFVGGPCFAFAWLMGKSLWEATVDAATLPEKRRQWRKNWDALQENIKRQKERER